MIQVQASQDLHLLIQIQSSEDLQHIANLGCLAEMPPAEDNLHFSMLIKRPVLAAAEWSSEEGHAEEVRPGGHVQGQEHQ